MCLLQWIDHFGLQRERKQNDKKQAIKNKFLNRKDIQEIRSALRLEQCQGCEAVIGKEFPILVPRVACFTVSLLHQLKCSISCLEYILGSDTGSPRPLCNRCGDGLSVILVLP